eukprot:1394578-Amorphochlora_amoeboformis.AAC.1
MRSIETARVIKSINQILIPGGGHGAGRGAGRGARSGRVGFRIKVELVDASEVRRELAGTPELANVGEGWSPNVSG